VTDHNDPLAPLLWRSPRILVLDTGNAARAMRDALDAVASAELITPAQLERINAPLRDVATGFDESRLALERMVAELAKCGDPVIPGEEQAAFLDQKRGGYSSGRRSAPGPRGGRRRRKGKKR